MKKIITTITLVLSLIAGQSMTFAREWNGWGQEADIFIAIWENEFKEISEKPMCLSQDVPENGGPMLDDEHSLLVPIDISMTFGYETTESDNSITLKHDKRTIVIHKDENKAEIDGRTIDLFSKQANGTTYLPYKSLDELFDIDLDWDAENRYLLITERDTTPVSEEQKAFRKRASTPPSKTPAKTPPLVVRPTYVYSDCDSKAVTELTNMEILSGDGNGKFRPNDTLTRAEVATMIAKAYGIDYMGLKFDFSEDTLFPDVPNDFWGIDYIRLCFAKDWIKGFEDGMFKPDENITFAEAVKICLSAAGYDALIVPSNDKWYEAWLEAAETYGLTETKGKDPDKKITRLEAAELVYKTMDLPMCVIIGTNYASGQGAPEYAIADGKTEVNGRVTELMTLYTQNFDWYTRRD